MRAWQCTDPYECPVADRAEALADAADDLLRSLVDVQGDARLAYAMVYGGRDVQPDPKQANLAKAIERLRDLAG